MVTEAEERVVAVAKLAEKDEHEDVVDDDEEISVVDPSDGDEE